MALSSATFSNLLKRRRGAPFNFAINWSGGVRVLQAILGLAVFGVVLFVTMQQFAHKVKTPDSAEYISRVPIFRHQTKSSQGHAPGHGHGHAFPPPGATLPSSSSFSDSLASLLSNIPSFSSLSDSLSASSSIGDKSATMLNLFSTRVKSLQQRLHDKTRNEHEFVEMVLSIFLKLKAINSDENVVEKDKRQMIDKSLNELIDLCMENVNDFKARYHHILEEEHRKDIEKLKDERDAVDSGTVEDEHTHEHESGRGHAPHRDDHLNEADLVPETPKSDEHIELLDIKVPASYHYSPPVDVSGEPAPPGMSELTAAEALNGTVCHYVRAQYNVHPRHDWGTLPKTMQPKWAQLNCDSILVKEDLLVREKFKVMSHRIRKREEHQVPPVPESAEDLPIVAICICTTTRGLYEIHSLDDLTLFSQLLPSLVHFAERQFHYRIYLLYDVGDLYFDQNGREQQVREWFKEQVQINLTAKSISASISILFFENTERKPGPAFNHVLRQAYDDGADWLYRINDDTVFEAAFASAFVQTLEQFGVPYGAVGPHCKTGNTMILTHDFTHRTHLDIFYPNYYPAILSDWWMDDWISRVYGRKRTKRLRDVLVKHFSKEGTRYEVNRTHGTMLDGELDRGRTKIIDWMRKNNVADNVIRTYQNDEFKFQVTRG